MIDVASILGPGGRIAARLASYEHRPQQLAMAEAVERALADGQHLVVEAGTGVGKSFAYLVPAIQYVAAEPPPADSDDEDEDAGPFAAEAKKPRRRVIISTHTISLQEQLLQKDLPLLRSVIPEEFTAVLVKGPRQLPQPAADEHGGRAIGQPVLATKRSMRDLRQVIAWSKKTGDGSLSDLSFRRGRPCGTKWQSDSSNCLGRKCPTYKDCFYFRARRRVHNAQLLIVNHALFFSDLALRRIGASILPDYDAVIFDEAHTLEAVAGDHLGLSVTSGQVQFVLNKLYNDRTNKGLLVTRKLREAQDLAVECHTRADELFDDALRAGPAAGQPHGPDSRAGPARKPAQPGAAEAGRGAAAGGEGDRKRIGAARFHVGPRPADGAGRRTDALDRAAERRLRSIGSNRRQPRRPAAGRAFRRADRRRPGPARAPVREDAVAS